MTDGKLFIDKRSTPGSSTIKPLSKASKYILSPCNKTLLNVVFDHTTTGLFRTVRSADKHMNTHCLPREYTLKRSLP